MSANKAHYPERPIMGKRPPHPGEARKKPSSEHIHGKRILKKMRADADLPTGPRPSYDKVDMKLSVLGHFNVALDRFFKHHRYDKVPIRMWGGRTRIEV